MMEEYIEIEDEDGKIHEMLIIEVVPFEGKEYAMLVDVDEEEEDDSIEVLLLRWANEEHLEIIEDENEYAALVAHLEECYPTE